MLADVGQVETAVPRDTDVDFEPQIVRRLTGVDEMVLSLSAKGLTHGEIAAYPAEVYGASVSKPRVSAEPDRAWPERIDERSDLLGKKVHEI